MKRRKNMKMVILALLLCTTLILSACGGSSPSGEAGGGDGGLQTMTLRMATDHPLDHMATRSANALIEEIYEKTDGRITINLYPASQLGVYDVVFEEIMRGSIDIAHITIPDQFDARLGSPYTPYLGRGYEHAQQVLAPGNYLHNEFEEYNSELGVKFLGFYLEGFIGMGLRRPANDVLVPGAPKGIQTRVWGAPASREPMTDLGYTPVTVPYAEAPTAIQTGVVDGWIGGTPNVNYMWVGEIINYYYHTYMNMESTAYVMNEALFGSLSAEDQQIFLDAFARQSQESFNLAEAEDKRWMEALEERGVEVYVFSDEDVELFSEFIMEHTWPKLEEFYTKEFFDGLRASL